MNYKDAFHKMVHSYPGGIEALAPRMGMTPGVLRNKANPNSTTNVLSADDLLLACSITGDYAPIHAYCAQLGLVCTQLEEQPASDMDVVGNITSIWQRLGDLAAEVHRTLEDGKVEAHEVDACSAAAFKAVRPILQLIETLDGMSEPRPAQRRS